METPVDKLYEQYYNQGLDELNKQKNTLRNTAESDKNIINTNADASVQNITDSYNTQIDDTKDSYEDAFRNNEVQVKLNERYLERKAAEMGLTDSGMNRTQMTANQLSYANQKGELTTQRQKAVDTLAAAMKARIAEVDIDRSNRIAQVESTLNNNLAQMDTDYASSVRQQAVDTYNTQIKAEQEAATARYKANADRINAAASSLNTLIGKLNEKDATDSSKWAYIQNYVNQHGASNELLSALSSCGYDKDGAFGNVARFFINKNFSDAAKVGRFVEFYKLYGMPSEKVLNALINNAPGHGVSYDELTKAIEEIG